MMQCEMRRGVAMPCCSFLGTMGILIANTLG